MNSDVMVRPAIKAQSDNYRTAMETAFWFDDVEVEDDGPLPLFVMRRAVEYERRAA